MIVDLDKLKKYFSITLVIRHRRLGQTDKYYHSLFRPCTQKDFIDRGYTKDLSEAHKSLCPDTESLGDIYSIMNNYASVNRNSFSIEFI